MTVERQHYVPKFYLKNFENSNHLIERCDVKNALMLKPVGKSGLCYENYFYGLITGEEDDISQYIERWLKNKEDILANELPRLIKLFKSNERIESGDKQLVAFFLVMMHFRGPTFRKQLNAMMQSGIEQEKKILANFPKEAVANYYKKRYANSMSYSDLEGLVSGEVKNPRFNNSLHLMMMNDMLGFSNMIWGQDWLIYNNNSNTEFVTSDNPFSAEPEERKGLYGYSFMDYTYHFTLTPELHIVTRSPKSLDLAFHKVHRKTLHADIDVISQNYHIFNSCQQYTFSSSFETLNYFCILINKFRTKG